jgi:hypothetical protein
MSQLMPFQGDGNTSLVTLTTSSQSWQVSTGSQIACRVVTFGSSGPVYIALGSSSVTAVVPTSGTPALGMPVQANTEHEFTARPNMWIAALTTSAGGTLAVTPGSGGFS